MYKYRVKRAIDFVLSLLAIIVLSPVLIVLAVLVHIKLGSPIIFTQARVGLNEKIIQIYKFRTMTDERDETGDLLSDNIRLTKFGNFLRRTSLDELPELFNIIRGDFSIVGPRALLVEYLPFYTEQERKRHSVRPGLTPPEVLYGNVLPSWEEQFYYEVDYVENVSLLLDIKIIFATFKGLVQRDSNDYGAYMRPKLSVEREEILQHESSDSSAGLYAVDGTDK